MIRLVTFCLFVFSPVLVIAQKKNSLDLIWLESKNVEIATMSFSLPQLDNQNYDGFLPHYYFALPISNKEEIELTGFESVDAPNADIAYLNYRQVEIPTTLNPAVYATANDQYNAILDGLPYIKEGSIVKRLTRIYYRVIPKTTSIGTAKGGAKNFATQSVLRPGSGDWYKISVDKDGIYKIDYTFLQLLGIDLENLNPSWINIYGNGDGRLPELNSAPRTDDLALNAIDIIGDGDGSFDPDDFILFYGWGPDRWTENGGIYERDKHIYSDVSVYFININPSGTPARVSLQSAVGAPNVFVTSHNFYDAHEQDILSLVGGGQRWYGELFDSQLTRTFGFTVPNIDNSIPARFEVSLASSANTATGTAQTYSVSGTQIFTAGLPTASEFGRSVHTMTYANPNDFIPLQISITRNSPSILTYLDKITLNARRQLVFTGSQFNFSDVNSIGIGNVAEYTISSFPTGGFVWDVTDRHQPVLMNGTMFGSSYVFVRESDSLKWYAASDGVDFLNPKVFTLGGKVTYQNIHALDQADYIIVTHPSFVGQAERLANLHRAQGTSVHVVRTDQVFNEFSSGMQDAGAIRTMMKMFWDRGASDPDTRPKHLLLFGDGTYDPKGRVPNNNNFVLTYQMINSEDHISAMPSDDFFGMLDDSDAMLSTHLVDIGVGRLLASSQENARELVDKIEHYMKNGSSLFNSNTGSCLTNNSSSTYGDWRTRYVQIADDEENNYFLNFDVEPQFVGVRDSFPDMNCEKIYIDAYQQVTTAGGERYPEVNEEIDRKMDRGALVINYVGHGGEVGWAEERILTIPMIQAWTNINNMPLIVSATCEFTKFDDPDRVSAGEWASLVPMGGGIALMTTTRSVFFGTNTQVGREFFKNVFKRDSELKPRTLGEIIMDTKNAVGGDNKRSFTLIGDPALRLAMPYHKIVTDSINGLDPNLQLDTLNALSKVTVKGHVEDQFGNVLNGYNGILYPSIFDKPKTQLTLSNDGPISPVKAFQNQTAKAYKGKASITNGYFEFSCIIPKDIDYSIDNGKISYYGFDQSTDAIGFDTMFHIGGVNPAGLDDTKGPDLELFLNDESFVDGGLTHENPILVARLFDENGINTAGNGIGHDLVAILDGETSKPIVLNDFYTADLDSYQSGEIRYNFSDLPSGEHNLRVKVWDVNNNSSEATLNFLVHEKETLKLEHVLNYPNPFTDRTEFFFEHNQSCEQLEVQIQIFTVSGRLVKTINQYVQTNGFRSEGIEWNGRDEFGDQLARGVYIYKISAKNCDGSKAEALEKLVLLK